MLEKENKSISKNKNEKKNRSKFIEQKNSYSNPNSTYNCDKKKNNPRESKRINSSLPITFFFFFHILTLFLLPSIERKRIPTMKYIKKKKKNRAQPTRDYSFRFIASSSWPAIVAVAPRTSSSPYFLPVIGRRFILPLYRRSRRIATL